MARSSYVLCALFLAGCASPLSSVQKCDTGRVEPLPVIKIWDGDQQARMAREVKALPQGSILIDAMIDYKRMRDELRR